MRHIAIRMFLLSCCVILTLTAGAKLYSATDHVGILEVTDPLLGVSNRALLWTVGVLELGIAVFLLAGKNDIIKCACVGWLALNFALYRLGMFWLHPGKLCPCLGTLTHKLHLKPETANWILWLIVIYMLSGSVFFLVREWQHRRFRKILSPVK